MSNMLQEAIGEIEERLQELSQAEPEPHTEADTLIFALAMLLAGRLDSHQEQVRVVKTIARYRKIKGMGNQPLKKTQTPTL